MPEARCASNRSGLAFSACSVQRQGFRLLAFGVEPAALLHQLERIDGRRLRMELTHGDCQRERKGEMTHGGVHE